MFAFILNLFAAFLGCLLWWCGLLFWWWFLRCVAGCCVLFVANCGVLCCLITVAYAMAC